MKEKIKEIQDYFLGKVLSKDFEIVGRSQYSWKILIDGEYQFSIWMENKPENRKFYHGVNDYFMEIPDMTEENAIKIDSMLKNDYIRWMKEELLEEKRKELNELEDEINKIEIENNIIPDKKMVHIIIQ
jgi:uncharacterized protein YaiE (UPF0345 family)